MGGLIKWLPLLLLFLFKRPKLLVPVLLIGGLLWYFGFFDAFLGGGGGTQPNTEQFFFGAQLDEEKYDQASVFEPLATDLAFGSYNRLPSRVTLEEYAPPRQHQGRQGSCVGWASAYAGQTILEAKARNQRPDRIAFSPSFLYNQIALPNCQGAYMIDAMEKMRRVGGVPFRDFGYNERSCGENPDRQAFQLAQDFRLKGYTRLTQGANNYSPDLNGIRQHLAQGAPVVIGMQVGGSFMHPMRGQKVWRPNQADKALRGFSGHAMCVIGYDDDYEGGAFQIMNSWGRDWGRDGIAWVRYPDFKYFVKEAYGLFPAGASPQFDKDRFAVEFGLVSNATRQPIPLAERGKGIFRTTSTLNKGDKFKVLFANSIECYVYILGQETDGSSYVLFPYTEKHSPYCGITGARLFPKDYSMVLDDLGNRDYIAMIVSKQPLDYDNLNALVNRSRQSDYAAKVREVLRSEAIQEVAFQAGKTIRFEADARKGNVVGMVLEIDKR